MPVRRPPYLSPAALLGLLAAALPAQDLAQRLALDAFERDTGGSWVCRWHEPTSTPRELFGSGASLHGWRENSLAHAREHALAALQRYAPLLGSDRGEFREAIAARMGRCWSFTFEQHHRGLPVLGGRLDVRISMAGRLAFLGSTAWPVPADFAVVPTLGEAAAVARAWLLVEAVPNDVPQPGTPRAPRLVVWTPATAGPVQLAWEVPVSAVDARGHGPIGRAFVHAHTGQLLQWVDDKHQCFACAPRAPHGGGPAAAAAPAAKPAPVPTTVTVLGYAHDGLSPVATPNNVPLPGLEVSIPGVGSYVTDQFGQVTVDLTGPATFTGVLDGLRCGQIFGNGAPAPVLTLQPGQPATLQFAAANAGEQPLAHTTAYLWTTRMAELARSILGPSPELQVADQVRATVNITSTCNAYYVGNSINFYQSGGGCNNTASASVVAHEWGHGLDDRYGGISQNNGLSEGWGDICSIYLLDDPTIGHDFWSGGGGIRTATNTRQFPSGNGPHAQGETWMGFAWKLRQNLRQSLGQQQAIAVSNDIVLGSIVANATDQPGAVTQVFLADDNDGNLLNGTPHYAELVAACNTHSLPFPQQQAGVLQHTPLQASYAPGTPRRLTMQAVPTFGSFTAVRVHYDDGQPRVRDLLPDGTANGYQALLPGVPAQQLVRYRLEATHSSGAVFRLPASGDYSYPTLAERRLWLEDFEAGGAGWTHGAVQGTDDWEIGVPQGRSGNGWSDPNAAWSGTRCAGTDLGGDGRYSPDSEMWLRSPPVDCRSSSSVRLRFRRWLSCEGSIGDQVQIRVNGTLLWVGPFAPTNDNGWVVYDALVPQAANHPAVVVEFQLRSNSYFEFGGWQIDDVEFYTLTSAVTLPVQLALLPEQAQQGTPLQLAVRTQGPQPFALALADQPGPTTLPGVPTLQVGSSPLVLFGVTDALGNYATAFPAPAVTAATGLWWYSQVVTLAPTGQLALSNAFVNLFTP